MLAASSSYRQRLRLGRDVLEVGPELRITLRFRQAEAASMMSRRLTLTASTTARQLSSASCFP